MSVCLGITDPNDEFLKNAGRAYGLTTDKNILHYFRWPARFLELLGESSRTRKNLKQLSCPTIFVYSAFDEIVSKRSLNDLKKYVPSYPVYELSKSGHYYYEKEDEEVVNKLFVDAFAN